MPRAVRAVVVVLAVVGVVVTIVVSRHTTARSVSQAVSARPPKIANERDLPVLGAGPAPSIEGAAAWLNTPGLTDPDLLGKVVLYDFWTYACINCRHTLPHVKAWQQRYANEGLVIVAIHSPEFAFERVAQNVADFVDENEITYPVALDPDRNVWKAWDNHYWPAFYLYDKQARLRVMHFGEGSYDTTEDAIRVLLDVDPLSRRAAVS